jgi:sugar lactone lactonase YvrE
VEKRATSMPQLVVIFAAACGACSIALAASASGTQSSSRDLVAVRAEIRRVEEARPRIADRGAPLYMLAWLYVEIGDLQRARTALKECVALDEGFEPGADRFKALTTDSTLRATLERFAARHPAVHQSRIAFTVPEDDLFPEGIAYEPTSGSFFLGSEYHNKIVRVDRDRALSNFVDPNRYHLAPVGGLRIDPDDHTLWAATDSAEFLHFDAHGQLLGRFTTTDPGRHILNDLVVRRGGDVYLTDTSAHVVYDFDRARHAFTPIRFHRPLFYPNGITLSPDERTLFVADLAGVVAADLGTGETHDVIPGPQTTLAGIDGLYWYRDGFVGVQYGTGAYRVVRWHLSPDSRRVTSTSVLEYKTDLVSFPTTGAIVGDDLYFVANTGIGNLQSGKIVDRSKLEPVKIAIVALR